VTYYDADYSKRLAAQVMYVGDVETGEAIRNVAARLPGDALELAAWRCFFQSVGNYPQGQCRPMRDLEGREWVIAIYAQAADLDAVIAEEIAHAYLKHGLVQPVPPSEEREREARELVRKWGFIP
jgi:hypothetical protein